MRAGQESTKARADPSVHAERAEKLFKGLRGARLDRSYEDEMRKLHRVDLSSTTWHYTASKHPETNDFSRNQQ